ncbi:MAG: histidinol dehydrogenase [Aliidongia sp.]
MTQVGPRRLDIDDPDFVRHFEALADEAREEPLEVTEAVAAILADIRNRGDAALRDYTSRFDGHDAKRLAIDRQEIDAAVAACAPDTLEALNFAADRIRTYHEMQKPQDQDWVDECGVRLGARWTAIEAVGLYVPGGTAAYPSSVLMNAIPAQVAGVDRLVMVTPAPDGQINPLVLAAARLAGIEEIYRVGGAQAIGALAYGTATIRPVDKIVGPGNAYVASAKRQVFGRVGIDTIAGPSEILVVADGLNDPAWIAADLLSQAEHDPVAQSILITDDKAFGDAVALAVEAQLATLPRRAIAEASWRRFGAIIRIGAIDEAAALVDRLAPEHVELAVAAPDRLACAIRNAGALFLGRYTPEAVGDYVAGPNHVLPTARAARFASGLGVNDFVKRTSLLACDPAGLAAIGPAAIRLAEAEGLHAHALSVAIRLPGRG